MKKFSFNVKDMLEVLNGIKLNKAKNGHVLTIKDKNIVLTAHGKDGLNTIYTYSSDIEYKDEQMGNTTSFDFWKFYDAIKDLSDIGDRCKVEVENETATLTVDYLGIKIDVLDYDCNVVNSDIEDKLYENNLFYLPIENKKQLINNLETLKKFTAVNENQIPIITGVKVEVKDNTCRFIAIDGFRFITIDYKIERPNSSTISQEDFEFVLNKSQLESLVKILRNNKTASQIEFTLNKDNLVDILVFKELNLGCNYIGIQSNALEGNFFDYTTVIPKKKTHSLKLNKNNLVKTTKVINKAKSDDLSLIVFNKTDNSLLLTDKKDKIKSTFSDIDNLSNYTDVKFGINSSYLLNSLDNINSSEVTLDFKAEDNTLIEPLVINDNNKYSNNNYYILPVRMTA